MTEPVKTPRNPAPALAALEPEVAQAASQAVRALARSDRSRAELLALLTRRCPADTAQQALRALDAQGWIDDGAAATRLAERWLQRDLLAPALVRERLLERGFEEGTCDRVLAALRVDARAAARALAVRIGVDRAHPLRLPRRLLRAGYDEELVRSLVRELGGDDL